MTGSLLLLAGCSGDDNSTPKASTYTVRGSVLLPDGKPLAGGTVYFVPTAKGTVGATGKVGSDGSFKLSTYGTDDGAAAGTYKVRIEPDFEAYPKDKKGAPVLPFNGRFTDEDTSELTAEVQAKDNELPPFRLDKKPIAKAVVDRDRD
ncbi:MAG: carboxypeptidase-like regulatory domain-containing protein [Isosphaeraceae bacterium]